jgi:hypothetical protein
MIYPVYGKGKLNWPSLPRSRIYIVVLLYKSLPRWSQFLFLKHIFLFSYPPFPLFTIKFTIFYFQSIHFQNLTNSKCVLFWLLITRINLLLLHVLIFFFYYWPFLYLFWIKYQLCYLKRCLYTQKFYLFIVTSFFKLFLVLFLCLLKIVYYSLKV